MFLTKRVVVAISLTAAASLTAAQAPPESLLPLENAVPERIDEVRETPNSIFVRTTRAQADGGTTDLVVGCYTDYFFIQDLSSRTDDRLAIGANVCENFRRAVHQRLDAQRKQSPPQ